MLPRLVIATLIALAAPASAEELPDRAQRALDRYRAERAELQAGFDTEVAELQRHYQRLQADHEQDLTEAAADATRDLKRAVSSRSPIAEQALVYREILRLDQGDADARAFFTTLGTLEDELAAIVPEQAAGAGTSVDLALALSQPDPTTGGTTVGDLLAAGIPFRVHRHDAASGRTFIVDYTPGTARLHEIRAGNLGPERCEGAPEVVGDTIHVVWERNQGFMTIPASLTTEPQAATAGAGAITVQIIPADAVGPASDEPGISAQQR